jgi:hypothetical protein
VTQLPYHQNLSTAKLASVFRNTSATYKFYWFWAVLEEVEQGKTVITKEEIFSRMIALSWYTVNYFRISFGKQDLIQDAVKELSNIENIPVDASKEQILKKLRASSNPQTISILAHFDKNVPHKFLSPWLGSGNKSKVYERSISTSSDAPYSLFKNQIVISNNWKAYFKANIGILKAFCYWNLTLFFQSRNPNVPDIANKIYRSIKRGSLNTHKTKFWNLVIDETGPIECIYTGKALGIGDYVIEHFIPHQFVAHDMMWNLIPADKSFNSYKSDKLPSFDTYFDSFFDLQKVGLELIKTKKPKNKFLEDYLSVFPNLEIDKNKFAEHIRPMLTIAHNNGFQYLS